MAAARYGHVHHQVVADRERCVGDELPPTDTDLSQTRRVGVSRGGQPPMDLDFNGEACMLSLYGFFPMASDAFEHETDFGLLRLIEGNLGPGPDPKPRNRGAPAYDLSAEQHLVGQLGEVEFDNDRFVDFKGVGGCAEDPAVRVVLAIGFEEVFFGAESSFEDTHGRHVRN